MLAFVGTSVLCVSANDRDTAITTINIPAKKLKLINNSMLPIAHSATVKGEKKKLQLLTVARLSPPKRVGLLVSTMKHLPECELTIVGDGPAYLKIEALIQQDNLQNVSMKGEIKGFKDFNQYDVFALISDSEGLPFSAMEAMSMGLPLVLSNVGGCSTLIDKNGVLVSNDSVSIANGVQQCMHNQAVYAKQSKYLFDKEFNLENTFVKYIDYYEDIMNQQTNSIKFLEKLKVHFLRYWNPSKI